MDHSTAFHTELITLSHSELLALTFCITHSYHFAKKNLLYAAIKLKNSSEISPNALLYIYAIVL